MKSFQLISAGFAKETSFFAAYSVERCVFGNACGALAAGIIFLSIVSEAKNHFKEVALSLDQHLYEALQSLRPFCSYKYNANFKLSFFE